MAASAIRPVGDLEDLRRRLRSATGAYDNEAVSLLAHQLQCAASLAATRPDDVELQVAGLVHDLGWLAPREDGVTEVVLDAHHDRVGAMLVGPLLGPRVARLVGGHVTAKRYLVATDPAYVGRLSERSVVTLAFQGGPLDADAVAAFASSPDFEATLALRRADETAKDPDAVVPPLEHWMPALERVVAARP